MIRFFDDRSGFFQSLRRTIKTLTFVFMPGRLPIKNLRKLNWIVSFTFALLFFILSLGVFHGDIYSALLRFLQSMVFMVLLSFANLTILSRFVKEDQNKETRIGKGFYLFSYLVTILDFLFVKILYSKLTGLKWEGEVDNIYVSYSFAILTTWVINTFLIVLQNLVILQYWKAQGVIENLQLKGNVTEMTNLLLRQQIHPHFLFNALSTIKSLYKKNPPQGEEYLIHLVNFLRVSISYHQTKTTLIKNELDFCIDYIKMQKIRFGPAFNYSLELSEQTRNTKYLPYFSLQSLVENALKHNDLTEESPVQITIREENGYVVVTNSIHVPKYKEASTGQGLSNLAERYRLLGEEDIIINSDDSFFTVRLKILDK
jgi:sensor histidine kinase YesM